MSPKYAKDQASGFTNRIEKVAIIGAGGSIGKYLAEALVKTGKHKVRAVTRKGSQNKLPDGLEVVSVDYEEESSLVEALTGQDFLIITMTARAPPDTVIKIIQAAAKAKVAYVMPNSYGLSPKSVDLGRDTGLAARGKPQYDELTKQGINWIGLASGFWYEFSLGGGPDRYGFDFKKRSLVLFDDGNEAINTSTWVQCGRAVASLLSLPIFPQDESDKSTTLSSYFGEHVIISSFKVSQRDMFESVKRVTGTTDADWTITTESAETRWKDGLAAVQKGDFSGMGKLLYSRTFVHNGGGDVEHFGLQNDVLGLPKEDLDQATKLAVHMGENDLVPY